MMDEGKHFKNRRAAWVAAAAGEEKRVLQIPAG
jgi:hypothetical protein